MKRLIIILVHITLPIALMAQLKMPTGTVNGNLSDYTYFHVTPTSGVTSGGLSYNAFWGLSGGPTKTIVPSDAIGGYLMKHGFNTISSIPTEFASKTLIISYGYTGRRVLSLGAYASGIIIQMRDATTQNLVASFEAEGCGADETDDILQAIYSAMALFRYHYEPKVNLNIDKVYKNSLLLSIENLTPYQINTIVVKLTYYTDGEVIHEQTSTINSTINSGYVLNSKYIVKDKAARNKKYAIKVELMSYN